MSVWQSPARTWNIRTGDCKDYATLKYAVLRAAGVPEEDLAVVSGDLNVGLMNTSPQHAFTLVRLDGSWLVMDSKFDRMILPKDYLNFAPRKLFSGASGWLMSRVMILSEMKT